jgi:2-methylcitrate dehydratase PrpD
VKCEKLLCVTHGTGSNTKVLIDQPVFASHDGERMNATTTHYTANLAEYAANATFSSIPTGLLTLLSIYMLDNFAVMLTGSFQPIYRSAVETVKWTYGNDTSRAYTAIDGTSSSLSAQILLMGFAAGDFEYNHIIEGAHPSSTVFPALLGVAAAYHKTGEELLTAMAVGYELATRIAAATTLEVEYVKGFHAIGLNGYLATAAAVGNLLGYNAGTIASAMGIAASSASGLQAYTTTPNGAMTRRIHPARAGQLGAEAALMAYAGIEGPPDVIENPQGYLHAFSPEPLTDLLTDGLGTEWKSTDMVIKLYPVHAWAQGFVYSINKYRSETNRTWNADDISNITIYGGPFVLDPVTWIPDPPSFAIAQYSVPFAIAAALTIDLSNPLAMNDTLASDPKISSIAAAMGKVQISDIDDYPWGYMTLQIQGQDLNITVDAYPGRPGADGYTEAVEEKFVGVIEAFGVAEPGNAVRDMILNVKNLNDVSVLMDGMVNVGKTAVANLAAGD